MSLKSSYKLYLVSGQAGVEAMERILRQLELALKDSESAGAHRLTRIGHR